MATAELKVDVEFFEELYDGADGWLTLWRKPNTRWLKLPEMPTETQPDEYFGVGIRRENLGGRKRGTSNDVSQVSTLWIDFDCDSPGKKKKHPNREQAEAIIGDLPLVPSFTVWSGGGFHLYWMLHEPVEAAHAERVLKGWHHWIQQRHLKGYQLDSVFDLSRVLRVPGSVNTKYGDPRLVEVLERNGKRYDLDDFLELVDAANALVVSKTATYEVGDLELTNDANAPTEKLEALLENSPEFRKLWKHKRELPSASEYDLALASHAVSALWTDQEVASLLVVHRRKYYPGTEGKLTDRKDYLTRTIAKARGDSNYDVSIRGLNGALDETEEPRRAPDGAAPKDTRQGILDRLSNVLGVQVARWVQFGEEDATYYLELVDGRSIRIGSAGSVLVNSMAMRRAIYESTRVAMKPIKGSAWHGVVESLASIVEIESQEEAGHIEAMQQTITSYLARRSIYEEHAAPMAVARKMPFTEGGKVFVNMEDLRAWVMLHTREKITRSEVLTALKVLGWERVMVHKRPSPAMRYWCREIDETLEAVLGIDFDFDDDE